MTIRLYLCYDDPTDGDDDITRNTRYLIDLTMPSLTLTIILLARFFYTAIYTSSNLSRVKSPFVYSYTASVLAVAGGDDYTALDRYAGLNLITRSFNSIVILPT